MTTVRRAGAALAVAWRAAPVLLLAYLGGSAVAGLMPVATVWLLKRLLDAVSAGSDALLVPTTIGFVVAGVLLSGGQWQRLALARTFLRDRRDLLILDEPSSGLDADAEAEIHRGLRSHRDGATSILISHRLGAVRDADHIVVLADGRITEQGDHSTLLAAGGVYARLFTTQAEGYRAESVPVHEGAVGELA